MKPVRGLAAITPGAQRYLEFSTGASTWKGFRDFEGSAAYQELIETLVDVQHGLCAYCEIALTARDRQAEHFIPKEKERAYTFAPDNLFAACIGGTNPHSKDPARCLPPIPENCSCGQYKGDKRLDGTILKPSELPASWRLFDVYQDGRLSIAENACKDAGISTEVAAATITELNLDCPRLRNARKAVWESLEADVAAAVGAGDDAAFLQALEGLARDYLMPVENGRLGAFFTTMRCYFGSIGEDVLQRQVAAWV